LCAGSVRLLVRRCRLPSGTALCWVSLLWYAKCNIEMDGILMIVFQVLASPYDVPDWLAPVLMALAAHVNDPAPINASVRRTFGHFWRTHQETWHQQKERFGEDDLQTLTELLVSPTYYA
jgi:hypothetical protein